MSPLDIVTLARWLGRSQREASLRAATSLAYYGAFHFAGERLEQLTADSSSPIRWTGANKNHGRLREAWRQQISVPGHFIATFLLHAHELRKKADYDLHLIFTPGDKDEAFQFVAQVLLAARRAG